MKLEVHLLTHDSEQMFVWAVRYWLNLGAKVVVHDGGPTMLCSALSFQMGVTAKAWDTAAELNDELARRLKNECWRGTDADFVAVVDADELLYFPNGVQSTLEIYERVGAAVIKPSGFEMFSDEWFAPEDFKFSQITELVTDGSPDDKWYSKPCLFSPRRIAESGFGIGAHESEPVLKDGRRLYVGKDWPKANPPTYLLHYKSIFGGIERIASRYDATRERLSLVNIQRGWGNITDSGIVHAQKKRDLLLSGVRRVIA